MTTSKWRYGELTITKMFTIYFGFNTPPCNILVEIGISSFWIILTKKLFTEYFIIIHVFLGVLHPLCGVGVTSPAKLSMTPLYQTAHNVISFFGLGPLLMTSTCFIPWLKLIMNNIFYHSLRSKSLTFFFVPLKL